MPLDLRQHGGKHADVVAELFCHAGLEDYAALSETDKQHVLLRELQTQRPLYNPYLAMFRDAKKPAAERAATFAADEKDLGAQLGILEGQLATHPYVAGATLSLADIALAPVVARCLDFPVTLPALPATKAWRATVAARPAFRKATGQ